MMVAANPITATEVNVAKILSNDYAFEIPPYQRPYAWELEQASELLSDLLDALDEHRVKHAGAYFLGSIVLIKSPAVADAKIVDGQQRLTTLTILISVIRDLTSDAEQQLKRHQYVCQSGDPDLGTQDRYRLLLRERDRGFFERTVQAMRATNALSDPHPLEGSERRIVENARFFRERLSGIDEARRDEFVAFVLQRCYLVVVAVPTAEAARRIFTVLNARGLDLTATDILKADLLERAGHNREAALARDWESIEEVLGRDRFVELFTHIRMIYEREKPRSALESAFRDIVGPFDAEPASFIPAVLEPLSEAMKMLDDAVEVQRQFGAAAAKAVRSLARIDNKDWVPPAILSIWLRKQGRLISDQVGSFLVHLERLAYYLFVTRADVNARVLRFASVLDGLDPPANRAARTPGIDLSVDEAREFLKALDGPIYRKTRVVKPVLQRLDEALSTGGAVYEDPTSIEHVLPQTMDADGEWAQLFPDEQVQECWTHRLANLVFLTRRTNIRASNWEFERKKRDYFQSQDGRNPYPLTQQVLDEPVWTPAILERRQARLLHRLAGIWNLPVPDPATTSVVDSA
ncbi:MAG: DUF262 domain-containing protein [Geminicoccaceae bacterium]